MTADLVVIGGGPAGATTAGSVARAGWQVVLVDPLGFGGQLVNVEHLADLPDHPDGIAGWDLAASLGEQALEAGVELVMGRAEAIDHDRGHWVVTADAEPLTARAVLVATGALPVPVPGAAGLEGAGVSYCAVCDGAFASGARAVVVGGGDTALAEAATLAGSGATEVLVVVAESEPTAPAARRRAVAELPMVRLLTGHRVRSLLADAGRVAGVEVESVVTGERRIIDTTMVFGSHDGGAADSSLLAGRCELGDDAGVRAGPELAVLGERGLFAAGDVRAGSPRRAAAAISDGLIAAAAVDAYLRA